MSEKENDFLKLNKVLGVGDLVYYGIHRSPAWKVVVAEDKEILSGKKVYNMIALEHGSCANSQEWFDSLKDLTEFYEPFIEKYIPFPFNEVE